MLGWYLAGLKWSTGLAILRSIFGLEGLLVLGKGQGEEQEGGRGGEGRKDGGEGSKRGGRKQTRGETQSGGGKVKENGGLPTVERGKRKQRKEGETWRGEAGAGGGGKLSETKKRGVVAKEQRMRGIKHRTSLARLGPPCFIEEDSGPHSSMQSVVHTAKHFKTLLKIRRQSTHKGSWKWEALPSRVLHEVHGKGTPSLELYTSFTALKRPGLWTGTTGWT